jgi:hypothetical protein
MTRSAMARWIRLGLVVGAASCSRPPSTANADPRVPTSDEGGCAPAAMGLVRARVITAWRAPSGCTLRNAGPTPTPVRDETSFARMFACEAGVASGVDWSRFSLWAMQTTLSPAGAGYSVFAEGSRVTLVTRQRSPCPDDPRPMPIPYSLAFLLPVGEVALTQRTCTLPPRCR